MAGAQFVKKKPDVVSALRPAFFIQYLESCISRLNVIPCHDLTLSVGEPDNAAAKLRSEQTVTPLHEQSPATYFLRLNNLETFVELVGARPLHLLSQTVLPLKSPTGAFIDSLRSSNANCFNFICNFMASAFFQLSRIINISFSIVDVEQNASFFAAVSDGTAQFKKLDVSLNFSAKVRYNHVTETAWPRKGARPGPCGP